MDPDDLILALRKPAAYGPTTQGAKEVEVIQTHSSLVFIVGEDVYKVKKSVNLGFLDYSTLDKREHFCREEVRVNRELAPHVYLGVVPIVRDLGVIKVGGHGHVIDWAVHMKRLPEEATLASRLEADTLTIEQLEEVARFVARFHEHANRSPEARRWASFEAVSKNALDNVSSLARSWGHDLPPLAMLDALTRAELEQHRDTIARRAVTSVARETHGDLRLDHIYLFPEEEPREQIVIIDRIEFDPRFRLADPVADMAFLVMELRALGHRELAGAFCEAYFEASGDEEGRSLLPFYVSYRAAIRAKVDALKAGEPEVPEDERYDALDRAHARLVLALDALAAPADRPCLVLTSGLPGVGKSSLSGGLARAGGFTWIRADVVRKALAGREALERGEDDVDGGIYTPRWNRRTYEACAEAAKASILEGGRAIVDATFRRRSERRRFYALAAELGVECRVILCEAEEDVVRERLHARKDDPSDANWAIYEHARDQFEAPGDREPVDRLDTSGTVETLVEGALALLREHRLWAPGGRDSHSVHT